MVALLKYSGLTLMGVLMAQDWKTRSISTLLLFVFSGLLAAAALFQQDVVLWGVDAISCLLFLLIQLGMVFIVFRIWKGRSFSFSKAMGLGDVLFLVALSLYYSFSWMWVIVMGGTLFSLIAWTAVSKNEESKPH